MGSKSQGGAQPLQATTVPGVSDGYYSNPPVTREAQPDAQNMLARLAGQLAAGYGAGGPGYEGTSQAQFAAQMEPYYQPVDIPDYRAANSGNAGAGGGAASSGQWMKPDMSVSWRYGGPAGLLEARAQGALIPLIPAAEGEQDAFLAPAGQTHF